MISVRSLTHRYGERVALSHLSFDISKGEIFSLLGPNGGGKTTLFKLLSTLLPIQEGDITVNGSSLKGETRLHRAQMGIVFQSPSLDKKLRVEENLHYHGLLYGLSGKKLKKRIDTLLEHFRLADRRNDTVEKLSGGLQRRVELAKSLLHNPSLLLLDEPTTGLDPSARLEFLGYLKLLQETEKTTILLTTHLLDEAELCHQVLILDRGNLVACDTPERLKALVGHEVIRLQTSMKNTDIAPQIQAACGYPAVKMGRELRVEMPSNLSSEEKQRLLNNLLGLNGVEAVTLSKPSLEDVYFQKTGQSWQTGK